MDAPSRRRDQSDEGLAALAEATASVQADPSPQHQKAWIELVQDRVYRFLSFKCGDLELARDLAQETLVRALLQIRSLKDPMKTIAWLLRLAHHLWIDHVRVIKNRPFEEEPEFESAPDEAPLASREVVLAVRQAISQLSDDEQTLLILSEVEEYSYAEIAVILKISESAVRMRLHRAKQALREKFGQE